MSAVVEVLAAWGWSSGSNTSPLACISSPIREVGLGIVALGLVPGVLWLLERTYGIKLEEGGSEGRKGKEKYTPRQ